MPTKPKTNYLTIEEQSNPRDCMQTPRYALDPLLPYLYKHGLRTVWEPAAGDGYLARWLSNAGCSVLTGDVLTGQNYFAYEPECYDIQVTNPPFGIKYRWLSRACALGRPFALLVPSDVLFAGSKAQPLIQRYGLEMLVPNQRINFKTPQLGWAGSAQMHTSWLTYGLHIGQLITFCRIDNTTSPE
jgi:hypothetical protein